MKVASLPKPLFIVLMLLVGLVVACASVSTAEPTQAEKQAELTEKPTATVLLEPTPTEEIIKVPAGVDRYLLDPVVQEQIKLGYSASYLWEYENGRFGGGKLILNNTPEWDAYFLTQNSYPDGQAYLARFSKASGAIYNLSLQSGEFGTTGFRAWAFHGGDVFNMSNREDENWLGYQPLVGNLNIHVSHWYYLLLVGNEEGEFLAVIWDAENPDLFAKNRQDFGPDWTGQEWKFRIGAKGGEVYLDELYRINFEDYR